MNLFTSIPISTNTPCHRSRLTRTSTPSKTNTLTSSRCQAACQAPSTCTYGLDFEELSPCHDANFHRLPHPVRQTETMREGLLHPPVDARAPRSRWLAVHRRHLRLAGSRAGRSRCERMLSDANKPRCQPPTASTTKYDSVAGLLKGPATCYPAATFRERLSEAKDDEASEMSFSFISLPLSLQR